MNVLAVWWSMVLVVWLVMCYSSVVVVWVENLEWDLESGGQVIKTAIAKCCIIHKCA